MGLSEVSKNADFEIKRAWTILSEDSPYPAIAQINEKTSEKAAMTTKFR